jgi:GNAT superfamily N-acetyltransferase
VAPAIQPITAEETIAIRLPILRAGMLREAAIFPGDDAATTRHFGAFWNGQLAGVASIYRAALPEQPEVEEAWQLRGMATLPEVRGFGCGGSLVRACLDHAHEQGGTLLWCNARTPAVRFYLKHGLQTLGKEFDIPTAGPHFRMFIALR